MDYRNLALSKNRYNEYTLPFEEKLKFEIYSLDKSFFKAEAKRLQRE
jgi:hypothetical protein